MEHLCFFMSPQHHQQSESFSSLSHSLFWGLIGDNFMSFRLPFLGWAHIRTSFFVQDLALWHIRCYRLNFRGVATRPSLRKPSLYPNRDPKTKVLWLCKSTSTYVQNLNLPCWRGTTWAWVRWGLDFLLFSRCARAFLTSTLDASLCFTWCKKKGDMDLDMAKIILCLGKEIRIIGNLDMV